MHPLNSLARCYITMALSGDAQILKRIERMRRAGKSFPGREYKNMCLSLQSPQLRRDLHEKTKTCFRGVSPQPTRASFRRTRSFSPFALTQPRTHIHGILRIHAIAQWSVRARRKEKLAQRDSLARRYFAFYNSKDIM